MLKESYRQVSVLSRGGHRNCQTKYILEFFVRSFRENYVFFNTESGVAHTIYRASENAPEVFGARKSCEQKTVQEGTHSFAAHSHLKTDYLAFPAFERGDGFFGRTGRSFLTGYFRQTIRDYFKLLFILHRTNSDRNNGLQ